MKVQILFDRVNHFHLLVRVNEEEEIGIISPKTLSGSATTERVEIGVAPSAVINPDGGLNEWRRRNWDYSSKTTSGVCNQRKGWGGSYPIGGYLPRWRFG